MTWWLQPYDPAAPADAPIPLATRPAASWSERFGAAVTAGRIEDDSWGQAARVEDDYIGEVENELAAFRGPVFEREGRNDRPAYGPDSPAYGQPMPRPVAPMDPEQRRQQRRRETLSLIARAKKTDLAKWGHLPDKPEDWIAEVNARRQAEYDEATAILNAAPGFGWGAEFMGRGWAGMSDPVSIATLPLGGPAGKGAWGFLKFIAAEAGLGAASELAIADRRQAVADELNVPEPDLLADMATAALFSGGLAGGIGLMVRGAGRYAEYRRSRGEGAERGRPAGQSPGNHEARIGEAAARLKDDAPSAPRTRDGLPPIGPDAPDNWQAIRGGIFAGESGGDFDALYGYSNRKGGAFEGVKVTEMTVDEAIAFSAPGGRYAEWSKGQVGRMATPMGAYQIVGKTLRAAKAALGLRGDELMTPELQERLGQWIYRQQGTGAWEGYRGPRADFVPGSNDGAAAAGFTPTTRGYTGEGQIAVGGRHIDVEYVVVDASLLRKAEGRFQPRDRSRINSDAWIADTAARLDPAQLMPAPTADRGAPIVGSDMMIESGNGRYSAILRAYEQHPDRAAAYRRQIEALGYSIPADAERPVLVARRRTELDDAAREQLTVDAQDSGVARMTPTEIAQTSARAMTAARLATFRPEAKLGDDANRDFLQSVLGDLPRSERNALFDEGGGLNAEGRRRMAHAFFARAWDDGTPAGRSLLARYAEAEDAGELKSLMDALDEAAPGWAALRAEIEAGTVRPEFDITGHVLDALQVIVMARREAGRAGGTIAEAIDAILAQGNLFAGPNPLSLALLRKFWRDGRAAPAAEVARFLNRYATEARQIGRSGDMLRASPADALRAIDGETFADLPDIIPPVNPPAPPPLQVPDLPETAFAKGADSPEAEAADETALNDLRTPDTGGSNETDLQIAATRAEFADLADLALPDGRRAADVLDEIEADQTLLDVIDACMIGATRT